MRKSSVNIEWSVITQKKGKKASTFQKKTLPRSRSGHSAAEAAAAWQLPKNSPLFNSGCDRRDSRPIPGDHDVMHSGATRHRGLLVLFASSVAAGVVLSFTTHLRVFSQSSEAAVIITSF